jgi:hypothetical protein
MLNALIERQTLQQVLPRRVTLPPLPHIPRPTSRSQQTLTLLQRTIIFSTLAFLTGEAYQFFPNAHIRCRYHDSAGTWRARIELAYD